MTIDPSIFLSGNWSWQQENLRVSFLSRYLEEPEALGTACGLYHFRSILLENNPSALFVLNADVCGDLPIAEMAYELTVKHDAHGLLLTTEATREQSINYGSVVIDPNGKVNL